MNKDVDLKKKAYISFLFFISFYLIHSQELKYESEDLEFSYSQEILLEEDFPNFNSHLERTDFIDGKYYIKITQFHFSMVPENSGFTRILLDNLNNPTRLKQILEERRYVFWGNNIYTDVPSSYKKLRYNEKIIGESYMEFAHDGLLYPRGFSYLANFITNANIYMIVLSYNDLTDRLPSEIPDIFYKKDGEWYWKNRSKITDFYNLVNNRKDLPDELVKLDKYWDQLLESLRIKNSAKTGVWGILNNYRVRIRTQPNLNGEQLGYLDKNQKVRILDQTSEPMQIGEMNSVWYKIRTEDDLEGWAYGYFIDLQ